MLQNNTEHNTPESSESDDAQSHPLLQARELSVASDVAEESSGTALNEGLFDLERKEEDEEEYIEELTEEELEEEYFDFIEEDNSIYASISSIGCVNAPLSLSFQESITPQQAIALFNSMVTTNYPLSLEALSIKSIEAYYRIAEALFYGIKNIGVPLKLSMYIYDTVESICYIKAITDALRERTKTAPIILKLSCTFYIGGHALKALAKMLNLETSKVSLHLVVSIFDVGANVYDESDIKKILKATEQNSVLRSLCIIGHIGSLAPALISMLNQANIPSRCDVYGRHANEALIQNVRDSSENNFLVSAILSPKHFLRRIGFDLYTKLQQDLPGLLNVLVKLVMEYWVEFYWADDEDINPYTIIAHQVIAAIKAIPGASNGNKYSSLNLNLLKDLHLVNLEEQYENSADVDENDGGSPEDSQASYQSSSSSPDDGRGGVVDSAELHDKETAISFLSSNHKFRDDVYQQVLQNNDSNDESHDVNSLFKKLFSIQDLPKQLQQQKIQSCGFQRVLKILNEPLNHNHKIHSLNNVSVQGKDVTEDNEAIYAKAKQQALLLPLPKDYDVVNSSDMIVTAPALPAVIVPEAMVLLGSSYYDNDAALSADRFI
jgi:hypothetical protein